MCATFVHLSVSQYYYCSMYVCPKACQCTLCQCNMLNVKIWTTTTTTTFQTKPTLPCVMTFHNTIGATLHVMTHGNVISEMHWPVSWLIRNAIPFPSKALASSWSWTLYEYSKLVNGIIGDEDSMDSSKVVKPSNIACSFACIPLDNSFNSLFSPLAHQDKSFCNILTRRGNTQGLMMPSVIWYIFVTQDCGVVLRVVAVVVGKEDPFFVLFFLFFFFCALLLAASSSSWVVSLFLLLFDFWATGVPSFFGDKEIPTNG